MVKNKIVAHLETWRLYSILWSGMVSLAGACLAFGDFPPVKIAALAFFIPLIGWIAALYAMDYLDRKLDGIQKSQRPIPSGRIQPKEAVFFAFFFAAVGLALSFFLGWMNVILVFLVAISTLIYSRFSKPRGLLANINRGLVTLLTFFFGVSAVYMTRNHISSSLDCILFLSFVFFIHDTNTNIVGAMRDVQGDRQGGYISTPVKYGIKRALIISCFLSILFISLSLFSVYLFNFLQYPSRFFVVFFLAVSLLCVMYTKMFTSIHSIDRKKALMAHEFFVTERVIFALAFIFGVATNFVIPLIIFVVSVIVTVVLQLLIRDRYEFERKEDDGDCFLVVESKIV
ncbi:MAG: hypothetical protein DRN33_02455 [Thermoplasmata archaeon]|nr:MAG: hypothetical protein DRN33_02455 [Thermoplasmata archaeon]